MKYLLLIISILWLNVTVRSQVSNNIKSLEIGDKIPDELWKLTLQCVNNPGGKNTITLDDYRGKLIVLDFWATWCTSCIAGMPVSHNLQKQFGGKMVVLPISYEPGKKVSAFISGNNYIKSLNLMSIVSDTALKKYFPHQLIPHYVWITQDGVVKAITSPDELTAANISKIINHSSGALKTKQDIDLEKPLFLNADLQDSKVMHYSVLTRGMHNGLPGGTQSRAVEKTTYRRIFTNSSIFTMYSVTAHYLFKELGETYNPNRLILNTQHRDQIDYVGNPSGSRIWNQSNLYNYDLIVPLDDAKNLYHYLLEDLNRYLNFKGQIEKRVVKCLVLKQMNSSLPIKSDQEAETLSLHLYARVLNSEKFIDVPVVNETGITDEIKLSRTKAKNLEDLRKELATHNLSITNEERSINMFVINDK